MRGMRENIWQLCLFLISVAVMVTGIVFYVKKSPKSDDQQVQTDVTADEATSGIPAKLSGDKSDSEESSEESESEEESEGDENESDDDSARLENHKGGKHAEVSKHHQHAVHEGEEEPSEKKHHASKTHLAIERLKKLGESVKNLEDQSTTANLCSSVEFKGDGQKNGQPAPDDWKSLLDAFHLSKKNLQSWLDRHRAYMTSKTFSFMASQLEKIRVVRPPQSDELDLNWRGIGVFIRDEQGGPLIRVSSGFIKLLKHESDRALFELTRLVAQSWSPCEMQKLSLDSPWKPLLKCLDIIDENNCGSSGYSEAGWAVSSIVAIGIAPLQCELPALSQPQKGGCLLK